MYSDSKRASVPRWLVALLLPGLLAVGTAVGGEDAPATHGWLEWAALEPDHVMLRAKLDSGARTSSLSALDIERFTRDGDDWVRFVVPISAYDGATGVAQRIHLERPLEREALIKRHGARAARRPVVRVELCLGGRRFTTPVTLTDRSHFNYPLLLGRTALRGRAIIDVDEVYLRGMAHDTCAPPSTTPAGASTPLKE